MTPEELNHARRVLDLAEKIEAGGPARPILAYLLDRADQEAERAKIALVDADPTDVARLMKLQNEARRHLDLTRWLEQTLAEKEAIMTGQDVEDRTEPLD